MAEARRMSLDRAAAEFIPEALGRVLHHLASIPPYAAYCRYLGRTAESVCDWRDIPAVPASAFKTHDLSAPPPGKEAAIFETSGTSVSKPGRVRLGSTALYEESLARSFERHLLPDGARLPAVVRGDAPGRLQ
jgi:hypothetical protein